MSGVAAGTGIRTSALELRARSGRALLLDTHDRAELSPERLPVSGSLVDALHEWAHVADRVAHRAEGVDDSSVVRTVFQRGRQLAAALAREAGTEVDYVDPSSGQVYRVIPQRPDRPGTRGVPGRGASAALAEHPGAGAGASGPTPWATGLTVSAIIAAIAVVALVIVSSGLAEVSVLLAVIVNVAMAAGFAPSIWLGRTVPVWRWVALGMAVGIALSWFALLLGLLG